MATIWITYAWNDNEHGDVDFVTQELQKAGLEVKLDRWNITAGKRLWEQIATFITEPNESDAWLLLATTNSLQSEPCKEEFSYALDRALKSRGQNYPFIALFLGPVDEALIPPAITTRLFVSITDPDWKERIVASVEGRGLQVSASTVEPYHLRVHSNQPGNNPFAIEVRPRAGVWAPFLAVIPMAEKGNVDPSIMIGPRDVPTNMGMLVNTGSEETSDGKFWIMFAGNQSTPTESYYMWCKNLPTEMIFGVKRGQQYHVKIR